MYEYQRNLWAAIAQVNYCWYGTVPVYKGSRVVTRHHHLVGREANVVATKAMGDYLEQAINRLCPWQGKECLSRSDMSWKRGCAERLINRLHERKWAMEKKDAEVKEAADGSSTAITLRSVAKAEYEANYDFLYGEGAYQRDKAARDAAAAAIAEVKPKEETAAERAKREKRQQRAQEKAEREWQRKWAATDVTAYHQGRVAGEKIGLDAQVGAGKAAGVLSGR